MISNFDPQAIGTASRRLNLCVALLVAAVLLAGCARREAEVAPVLFSGIERLPPAAQPRQEPLTLHLARGEREGVQVVIAPDTRELKLQVGGAPGIKLRVYEQQPLAIATASPGGSTDTRLDPLLPLRVAWGTSLELPKRAPQVAGRDLDARVLWVDVHVTRDAKPGKRVLRVGDANATLVVHDVLLPERPTLKSSIGVDESQIRRFEQVEPGTPEWHAQLAEYFDQLLEARLSPADLYVDDKIGEPDSGFAQSPGAERLARVLDDPRNASARIPFYQTHPFKQPLGADRAAAIHYLRETAAYFEQRGWLERSYVYVYDEPPVRDAARVRDMTALVHEADPRLRVLLTTAPAPAFAGSADIWVPNIGPLFRPVDLRREQKAGRGAWWYPSISTNYPYPTLFVDDLRPAPRALGWLAFRNGVEGLLYWSATHWHEVDDPWADSATFHDPGGAIGNGDGVLLYPGRPRGFEGPAPSVRLLQLRDGIEDHDLLTMLAQRDKAQAETIAGRLARSLIDFEADPQVILAQRQQLLKSLEG